MIAIWIIYVLSGVFCALVIFLIEFPTDENYVEILRGNRQMILLILFITSFIPVINTIVAIWLFTQIEIHI